MNLQQLKQELRVAADHYDKDVQIGSAVALSAVLEYLATIDVGDRETMPIKNLVGALLDASRGIRNEHIAVKPQTPGASRMASERADDMSRAAAAVSLLIESGEAQATALQKVVRALSGRVSAQELMDFRKRVNRAHGRVPEAAKSNYHGHMAMYRRVGEQYGLSPRQLADHAVKFLKETTLGPHKVR